jgi:hypothetical protein
MAVIFLICPVGKSMFPGSPVIILSFKWSLVSCKFSNLTDLGRTYVSGLPVIKLGF